jgi:O-antigen ligase
MTTRDLAAGRTQVGNRLTTVIGLGLFWLIVGVGATPGASHSSSIYHWIVTLLLLLPALWIVVRDRGWMGRQWWSVPELRLTGLLLLWSAVSLFWATGAHVGERIKVPLQVALFLCGWLYWTRERGPWHAERLLWFAGLGLAATALVAMLAFPWRITPFADRIIGFNMLDGPNLSGYVMGAAAVWLFQLMPATTRGRLLWAAAMACLLAFVALTFSRGSWLALFAAMLLMPLVEWNRRGWASAALAVLGAIVVSLYASSAVDARGMSYRPEIFEQALDHIRQHPWRGLGLDTPYRVTVGDQSWTHSHNLFTNLAIEIGLPALAVWLAIWLLVAWRGWRNRDTPTGRIVLSLWIFATVALQLDGPALALSPRPEWLLTWLPLALAAGLATGLGRLREDGTGRKVT